MKHHIIVKFTDGVTDKAALVREVPAEEASVSAGPLVDAVSAALTAKGIRLVKPESLEGVARKNTVARIPAGIVEAPCAVADTATCSDGASNSQSSSLAISMKWRAASRVLGPLPGRHSSGLPNRRCECTLTALVPRASSRSAAMVQFCAQSIR